MKILTIACSEEGVQLQQRLMEKWHKKDLDVEWISIVKSSRLPEISDRRSLSECVGDYFTRVDGILFLCAAGIAVRSIAPYIRHKSVDPAVIVIDETGKFCIPILSGHGGGANELAKKVAKVLGAIPVITTATDREGKFAVDEFARKNNLLVTDWKLAKDISVNVLAGEKIRLKSELPCQGNVPLEVEFVDNFDNHMGNFPKVWITSRQVRDLAQKDILVLVPKDIVAGIGCRKDIGKEAIEAALNKALKEAEIEKAAVCEIASIDLKKEEKGLTGLCEEWNVPFVTYCAEQLQAVEGEFAASEFVRQITGVDNVCERCAAIHGEEIIFHKKAYDGVTVALSRRKGMVEF